MFPSYVCPHCGIRTIAEIHPVLKEKLDAFDLLKYVESVPRYGYKKVALEDLGKFYDSVNVVITRCLGCGKFVLWIDSKMVWPKPRGIPASPDMPEKARKFFDEAQDILYLSPRSACALLRICLEILVNKTAVITGVEDFNPKDSFFKRIEALGVDKKTKEILHACRVGGNANVHPGVLDLTNKDSIVIAEAMSKIINKLVSDWITVYKQAEEIRNLTGG